jgi:hypothetical protein
MSTADNVVNALSAYNAKPEGRGRWRFNSPLRPGPTA